MKRVTGIGGIFFKAADAPALRDWYRTHLGIPVESWGGAAFPWHDGQGQPTGGSTTWQISGGDSAYYEPSRSPFMVNYRVENLEALLAVLREEGCQVLGAGESSEYGRFGWVLDPEGNKIELWQPPEGQ